MVFTLNRFIGKLMTIASFEKVGQTAFAKTRTRLFSHSPCYDNRQTTANNKKLADFATSFKQSQIISVDACAFAIYSAYLLPPYPPVPFARPHLPLPIFPAPPFHIEQSLSPFLQEF